MAMIVSKEHVKVLACKFHSTNNFDQFYTNEMLHLVVVCIQCLGDAFDVLQIAQG
ncbi:MAG: hypothetical protein PWQ17_1342 [Anaerophaga sp.]|nr:hypothetical protein [Anaerophaga sp.]MDK2841837.1 hypothetical protein [Anaerophaga sp.]MDK2962601.1 hypothetical protein [Eubacteriaceae bacterium]MDN5291233.1 hypothetical protein [Anaerophaga sp.]